MQIYRSILYFFEKIMFFILDLRTNLALTANQVLGGVVCIKIFYSFSWARTFAGFLIHCQIKAKLR